MAAPVRPAAKRRRSTRLSCWNGAILLLGATLVLASESAVRAQDAAPVVSPAAETRAEAGETAEMPQEGTLPTSASAAPVDPAQNVAQPDAGSAVPAPANPPVPGSGLAADAPAAPGAADGLFGGPAALSRLLGASGRDPDLPHDLSPWGMFLAADWVVKAVMTGLAFASFITWTIWLAKSIEIALARAKARRTLASIVEASSVDDAALALSGRGGPAASMIRTADGEMSRSEPMLDHAGSRGLSNRVQSHLTRIESQAGRRLSRGTGILATIGSTAPFVGLFGTVWGIMNAFIGISEAQTTNLAIVAPGIAEALLATAIGLVAAIPAVVFYNVFARSIAGYRQVLADASAAVERLVSLDLDRRKVASPAARQAAG